MSNASIEEVSYSILRAYGNAAHQLLQDASWYYFEYKLLIWTTLLLTPVVLVLALPTIMLALVYISALYLKAYRYYHKINGYVFTPDSWKSVRSMLAYLWDAQARFWYGYEIEGLENIPDDRPALIVFYHGSMPVDWYYLLSRMILVRKRIICAVGDRFLFKVPAFDAIIDCFQVYPGTVDSCADILQKGNLLAIAPGGVREALFADENYPLIWESRKGFAKVALKAKVPVIPVFTRNIREAFFTFRFGRNWLRGIYERTRIPLVPIFGGFPVKLTTIVGTPIEYDSKLSADELTEKVAQSMRDLIKKHQKTPGSVKRGVLEYVQYMFKRKNV